MHWRPWCEHIYLIILSVRTMQQVMLFSSRIPIACCTIEPLSKRFRDMSQEEFYKRKMTGQWAGNGQVDPVELLSTTMGSFKEP